MRDEWHDARLQAARSLVKAMAARGMASPALPCPAAPRPGRSSCPTRAAPTPSPTARRFYDPFEKERGIKVVSVARESQPVAQFTAMVETRNYIWDVTTLTLSADIPILEERGLLEPLGLKAAEFPGLMPEALTANWLGVDVYSTVLAYRTDKLSKAHPENWADFWDVKRFPGPRSLRRNPIDTLEQALLADGVPHRQAAIPWMWIAPSAAWTRSASTFRCGGRAVRNPRSCSSPGRSTCSSLWNGRRPGGH